MQALLPSHTNLFQVVCELRIELLLLDDLHVCVLQLVLHSLEVRGVRDDDTGGRREQVANVALERGLLARRTRLALRQPMVHALATEQMTAPGDTAKSRNNE